MESSIRRRNNVNNMSFKERQEFNIQQREKYPDSPRPYLPIPCANEKCQFHFIPIDNAYEVLCPIHRMKNPKINPCPFMNHELTDSTFFTWGVDEDLPTDFNHANYTPLR